jgi:DNA-binding MarR family transcriptional regulator
MARAYLSGDFTMKEIGEFFGVHYMTVSRAVQKSEAAELVARRTRKVNASVRGKKRRSR